MPHYNSVQITGLTSQILAQHEMNQSCGPQEEQERIRVPPSWVHVSLRILHGLSALLLLKCVFMLLLFFDSIYFRQGTDRADRGQHQLYQIGEFLYTNYPKNKIKIRARDLENIIEFLVFHVYTLQRPKGIVSKDFSAPVFP